MSKKMSNYHGLNYRLVDSIEDSHFIEVYCTDINCKYNNPIYAKRYDDKKRYVVWTDRGACTHDKGLIIQKTSVSLAISNEPTQVNYIQRCLCFVNEMCAEWKKVKFDVN
jgi:hypothetical protein